MIAHEWQSRAIDAFQQLGGAFVAMPPGSGKTFVAAACAKLGERPVVVCPASAVAQTESMFRTYDSAAEFRSYNAISLDETLLDTLRPDVLIVDEAHNLKNVAKAAWSRRISRYLAANPSCRVVVLTGSIMHRSAADYLHLLVWALRSRAPCPRSAANMKLHAKQCDEKPEQWLALLRETPGVFIDAAPSWAGELVITERHIDLVAPDAYYAALATSKAPDGWLCEGPLARGELLRQLAWGWYMRRDPRPSEAYVEASREWSKAVDQARMYGLADTEMGARGVLPGAYAAFRRVADREAPSDQVVEWLAPEGVVATVLEWLWEQGWQTEQHGFGRAWVRRPQAAAASGRATSSTATAPGSSAQQTGEKQPGTRIATAGAAPSATQATCSSVTAATTGYASSHPIFSSAQLQTIWQTACARAERRIGKAGTLQGSFGVGRKTSSTDETGARGSASIQTCLIWVGHVAIGQLLSAVLGVPYHREGTRDAAGTRLDEARCPIALASISACNKSCNAQHFNTMLFVEVSSDARVMQQAFCRVARQGQPEKRVTCEIVISAPSYAAELETAREQAKALEIATGQEQLLLRGATT